MTIIFNLSASLVKITLSRHAFLTCLENGEFENQAMHQFRNCDEIEQSDYSVFFYMLIRVFWGRMHVTCMCVWVSQGILWMSKRCQRRWTMKVQISVPNLTNIFFINGNHFCSHSDPESSIILNGLFDFRFLIFDQILACMGVPNTVVQFTKAQSCYLITTPWIHVQMHTLICTYIHAKILSVNRIKVVFAFILLMDIQKAIVRTWPSD